MLKSDFSSFWGSVFSLDSEAFSFSGLSSNFSKDSLRAFSSLSTSSWLTVGLSISCCARDKERFNFSTESIVFLLKSIFLIFSINSIKDCLLTSVLATSSFLSSSSDFFDNGEVTPKLISLSSCLITSSLGVLPLSLSSPSSAEFIDVTTEDATSSALTTCVCCNPIAPVAKKRVQPKRKCFPFFTILQFFWFIPLRLNNITETP